MENNIPKKIHYCWFGDGKLSDEVIKCINSWKKYCPDYEIIQWNEQNYDISKNDYMREAYENKKWSFVSDYARLDIVYSYGGVYLDTDVELIRNIDELLKYNAFFGFESDKFIASGLGFGAMKGMEIIKNMKDIYFRTNFINADGTINYVACPVYNTAVLKDYGFKINGTTQIINNICVLSSEYFAPLNYSTGRLDITDNTYSIHWYNMSWKTKEQKKLTLKVQKVKSKFGKLGVLYEYLLVFKFYLEQYGIGYIKNKIINKLRRVLK